MPYTEEEIVRSAMKIILPICAELRISTTVPEPDFVELSLFILRLIKKRTDEGCTLGPVKKRRVR